MPSGEINTKVVSAEGRGHPLRARRATVVFALALVEEEEAIRGSVTADDDDDDWGWANEDEEGAPVLSVIGDETDASASFAPPRHLEIRSRISSTATSCW